MTRAAAPTDANPPLGPTQPIDLRDLRNALGCFATGVTVITAVGSDRLPVALTINSFTSVSLDPALVLWCLSVRSPNLPAFRDASHFAINVLGRDREAFGRHFARRAEDKFSSIRWTAGLGGAPLLDGTVAQFQCRKSETLDGGDHVIFLGAVEAYEYGPGEPLLFSRGHFGTFSPEN
ncbi:MAG: flavin reductase family protein [Alsobacter sp.]